MLFGEETWAMTECPRHKIEYIGCFCPECFSRPKHLKLEKYAGGKCISVTIDPDRELSPEIQELFDRWKNSSRENTSIL